MIYDLTCWRCDSPLEAKPGEVLLRCVKCERHWPATADEVAALQTEVKRLNLVARGLEQAAADSSRLLAESERRRVELIDRHEAERRVLTADVCRQADRAEDAERREAEAQAAHHETEEWTRTRFEAQEQKMIAEEMAHEDTQDALRACERERDALKAEVERLTAERDEWRRRVGCRPECTLMCCDQDCDNSGVEDPDGRNAWDLLDDARASALRWYRADGTYEVLGSPEEVVERRKEAAKVLSAASALRERVSEYASWLEKGAEESERASVEFRRAHGNDSTTADRQELKAVQYRGIVTNLRALLAAAPTDEEG